MFNKGDRVLTRNGEGVVELVLMKHVSVIHSPVCTKWYEKENVSIFEADDEAIPEDWS